MNNGWSTATTMSAGEPAPTPNGGKSLLRGSRTRSYGSLVQSSVSPVRQRLIDHQVQPGETLQGLALKYGVSMEQIKRVNRLYTNDSIFLKKSLSIPVLQDDSSCQASLTEEEDTCSISSQNGKATETSEHIQDCGEERSAELSPMDYLNRMDCLIRQSMQLAVKGCQEGEKRFAAIEAACASRMPDQPRLTRSQSAITSPRIHQQTALAAVPLTKTKHTKNFRETEDEIFQL